MEIAPFIDSTNLKPEATELDISNLCEEAVNYNMAAVCVQPYRVKKVAEFLSSSSVKPCTVIGFPLGADGVEVKLYSANTALEQGAKELDLVINIGAVKDNNIKVVSNEIEEMLKLKLNYNFILKVIVETALLTQKELIKLTELISYLEADYIKTSTGFASRGVNMQDIKIINNHKSNKLKIKASGGIKDFNFALDLINAGVSRLGTSSAKHLILHNA
ncbi:Deoxyribose-phosphate aldolase [Candidatus Syntrophocurvum alkaliphilum]|uniref:Deoxyribose-phosphate aldolase n=1 Tax=Candidatus Syntrophocurvum alkaliphilum TaxID=2293317 RepID=A0A6I6DI60_9FIRM|nr:deoxyribose-phosphate aldolase [Candidatus Syntrophocurvum alkaliphilum]QGT99980.1 Deoxyribose-phosphate aldolase [Candidatus Syntrophocurvum alkaliphilum]